MRRAFPWVILAAGWLLLAGINLASADALLLKDGRFITGEVTHTSSGYVVKTADGVQTFSDDEVQHWAKSHPTGGAAPAPAEAPADTTSGAPAAPAAPPTASATRISKTLNVLLTRGNDALAAGDYNAARGAFADAVALSSRDPIAAQGLGFCLLQLKNYVKARDTLEIAYATVKPLPRSLAANLAIALTRTHNPMRAAKVLREYLVAHPELLDEPALNALADAMFSADDLATRGSFYQEMSQFYETYNGKLEATRPGEKRWGTSWLAAEEADRKKAAYNKKRKQVAQINYNVGQDLADGKAAEDAAAEAVNDARFDAAAKRVLQSRLNGYQQQMNQASARYQRDTAALVKAKESAEDPPIDDSLAIVMPESVAGSTAVASAGSTSSLAPAAPPAVPAPAVTGSSASTGNTGAAGHPQSESTVRPGGAGPSRSIPVATPAAPAVIVAAPIAPPAPNRKLLISIQAVAFPVASDLLVTTSEAVANAAAITVTMPNGDDAEAEFVKDDAASGLALVRLKTKKLIYLPLAGSFAGGGVQCLGFPEVNLFDPAATSMAGSLGAAGEKWTLSLGRSPRLAGGPIMSNGAVVGVELATRDSDTKSIPAATLEDLKRLVGSQAGGGSNPAGGLDPKGLIVQLTAVRSR